MRQKQPVSRVYSIFLTLPLLLSVIFVLFCTTTDPQPALSDLQIINGNRFVAYQSYNRHLKPDTLYASWYYSGSDLQPLEIEIKSMDESILIPIEAGFSADNETVELLWVPGADSVHFTYFGDRPWILSVTDSNLGTTLTSDTLIITGPAPLILDSPETPSDHPINDTLFLQYRINTDRISQIRTFYRNDLSNDWIEFVNDPTREITNEPSPVTEFEMPFIPAKADTLITNHSDLPIRFLLKDYQSPFSGSTIETDDITLTE